MRRHEQKCLNHFLHAERQVEHTLAKEDARVEVLLHFAAVDERLAVHRSLDHTDHASVQLVHRIDMLCFFFKWIRWTVLIIVYGV